MADEPKEGLWANWPAVAGFVSVARKDTYPFIDPSKVDLTGKSVLISGASKGIGRTTAIRFAVAGCAKILLLARSDLADVERAVREAAKEANRPPPAVHSLQVDVTSAKSVDEAAATASSLLDGRLDILVNNAGYLAAWVPMVESDPDEWWRTWEVNIKGAYLVARSFIPLLLASPTKTVINVASAGAHVTFPGASAYQTTKLALCRLTQFMDQEYAQRGLVAVAIHPGAVRTELASNMPADHLHVLTDTPELAADTILWLTRERRDWLSGRFASVNWDMEELERKRQDIVDRDLLKFRMAV